MSDRATCDTCSHWQPPQGDSGVLGQCRRYPPALDGASMRQAVPFTPATDWCGEHRPEER